MSPDFIQNLQKRIANLICRATLIFVLLNGFVLGDEQKPPDTLWLSERYRQLGGSIEVIKTGTEQSHGHHFPMPDPQRMADFIIRHASLKLPWLCSCFWCCSWCESCGAFLYGSDNPLPVH